MTTWCCEVHLPECCVVGLPSLLGGVAGLAQVCKVVRHSAARTGQRRRSCRGAQALVEFQLAEQLYARAMIRQPTSVALWLGADVMLEFPLQEAADLLVRSLPGHSPAGQAPPRSCAAERHWRRKQVMCSWECVLPCTA